MTYKSQHSKIMRLTQFSATVVLSILLCSSSLSNTTSSEKKENYLNAENFKTQLLEDSTFLSKLKEKITPHIDDHDIQKIVRDYLLANPEIMIKMQFILQEKLEKQREQDAKEQALIINLLKNEIFKSPYDAVLGNPNGKRVLVDFFDYNCKYCKISYSYIEDLIKKYPDLRIIIKDLPILGPDSIAAHTVAYAFRQQLPEKYPQFHKTLLNNKSRATESNAIKIAISLGANEEKLRNAIKDLSPQNLFKENMQIASAINITGTPSYIIGNKVFIGVATKDILKEAVENLQ
ncbi:DsbA family protein [Bartonella sp. CB169]|uniref:DsbA family protein n=1 Tax=Bartonella sp. CB169 TaxID=3112257 RepID=UPI00300E23C7